MDPATLPKFDDIPPVEGMPHGTAWGLFDKDGKRDNLGTLNFLTPPVVARAGQEIKAGVSVALNWGLEKLHEAGYGRIPLKHNVIDWRKAFPGHPLYCYDDEVTINTQAGSQWDGLKHWGHLKTGLYYNGLTHEEIATTDRLGIENWTKRGGIAGRGVLIDYQSYAERKGIDYSAMSAHAISLADIKAIAEECGIEFLPGDLLLVRTGWVKWYEEHNADERREKITNGNAWVGVQSCEETVRWLWENHFAAVAADSIGFEVWPADDKWRLHDWLLSMWGCPIGEMWDLEALAAECKKQNRWSFFLTSSPLNVTGGIASPPNAIAVF